MTISSASSDHPTSFALIIGGMKCGTTSLFDLLAQHPAISPCRVKEPDFFAQKRDPRTAWDQYLSLWNWKPGTHHIALEASTAYTKYPWVKEVPERIVQSPGASFRFIYMLRNPVERIASQVKHGLYDGWGHSLDEGFADDLIDFSKYSMQMDRYVAWFPRESILPITLDELHAAPRDVLRRVCQFLGVDPEYPFSNPEEPRNAGDLYAVSPVIASLTKNRSLKWVLDRVLSRGARHRVRQWLSKFRRNDSAALGRWRLNPDEVARVYELLSDDMTRLREEYGVRAPWLERRHTGSPEDAR